MKTYNERMEDILQKTEEKHRQRTIVKRASVLSCFCAGLIALNLVLFLPFSTRMPSVEKYKDSEYYGVIQTINQMTYKPPKYKNNFQKWTSGLAKFGAAMDENMAAPENSASGLTGGNGYVETTDNQVSGVVEGDLFKRTNTHIFYMDYTAKTIRAYSIAEENSVLVGEAAVRLQDGAHSFYMTNAPEIYLSADGKNLTLVSNVSVSKNNATYFSRYTMVVHYDVSNPAQMQENGRTYFSGDYLSSRMVDGDLLLFNNFIVYGSMCDFDIPSSYLPHYGSFDNLQYIKGEDILCPENATNLRYTVVYKLNGSTAEIQDALALFSYSTEAYVSEENIFITRPYTKKETLSETAYQNVFKTDISCVYYGGDGFENKGIATVNGRVKNQYSMDEYNGVLRVVTTVSEQSWSKNSQAEYEHVTLTKNVTGGSLYCVDLQTLETVASEELFITDETVQSVRFDGEKAYVCTAVVVTLTDPVFVFDLSDLSNITYKDTGVIAGYSTSLVDFKNGTLLGIGYGESGGLKIEIYMETQTALESVCAFELEGVVFSEEYKSYYIDRDKGLIGLCVEDFREGNATYYLFQFDGYGIVEIVKVNVGAQTVYICDLARATVIEGTLYVFTPAGADLYVKRIFQ